MVLGQSLLRSSGLGLPRHFDNRRQVAAYAGLAPTPWQSGSVNREQGISQSGNPQLWTTMIQLAWLWVRHPKTTYLTATCSCEDYAAAVRDSAKGMLDRCETMMGSRGSASLPERMDLHEQLMAAQLDAMRATNKVLKPLYAAFSED
jgi:hypothetical protein